MNELEKTLDDFPEGGLVGVIKVGDKQKYFTCLLSNDMHREALPALMADIATQLQIGIWGHTKYCNKCEDHTNIAFWNHEEEKKLICGKCANEYNEETK